MTDSGNEYLDELPVVAALRSLSVFSADQSGAYREHYSAIAKVLGDDAETKLGRFATTWAGTSSPGALILTGNAGTGKTAVAEAYCRALGANLPESDDPTEVLAGRWVVKDLSGLADPSARATAFRSVMAEAELGQAFICANEGVLRDALQALQLEDLQPALDHALRHGAARDGSITIINVNRQRPTSDQLWPQLLDYLTRAELWEGCRDCPYDRGGCPMRSNAEQLRSPGVQAQARTLFRLAAGEAVPTLREVLAILAWAIVGGQSCHEVKTGFRDRGPQRFTASQGYFNRMVGSGLPAEAVERSPLLSGMRRAQLGDVSDLEIDGWLRDTTGAPHAVQYLAGDPSTADDIADEDRDARRRSSLAGSRSNLDRVRTKQGAMTFHALGEMVSTDEDPTRVEDGLDALVVGDDSEVPAQTLWRRRIYFEAPGEVGGEAGAAARLLDFRHIPDLLTLARLAAGGRDTVLELNELVKGLNFLVTGFSSPTEGLVVPDPACLFARDPGSFRPARPSLVHSQISIERLSIDLPDTGLVEQILDIDYVDVNLTVDDDPALSLRIRPRMYEAIREAAEFQGPVGQGVAEMNDLRDFYGRLATLDGPDVVMRVADPDSSPPSLVRVSLPHFASGGMA